MTKAEEIYEGYVEYERTEVNDRLKKSIIGAINKALTIPVVDSQRELLSEPTEDFKNGYKTGWREGYQEGNSDVA